MLDVAKFRPEDAEGPRRFTALLLAEVTAQAMLIETLRPQLAGPRNHRFGISSGTIEQLRLARESEPLSAIAPRTRGERDCHGLDDGEAAPSRRGDGQT